MRIVDAIFREAVELDQWLLAEQELLQYSHPILCLRRSTGARGSDRHPGANHTANGRLSVVVGARGTAAREEATCGLLSPETPDHPQC